MGGRRRRASDRPSTNLNDRAGSDPGRKAAICRTTVAIRPLVRGLGHRRRGQSDRLVHGASPLRQRAVRGAQEPRRRGAVHPVEQRLPVADDVEQHHGLGHDAQLVPREHLGELVDGSDALRGAEYSDVLETFRMFAHDKGWVNRMREAVDTGLTAEAAVERVQGDNRARMQRTPDPYLRDRIQRKLETLGDVGQAGQSLSRVIVQLLTDPSLLIETDLDDLAPGKTVTGVLKLDSPEAVELMLADGKLVRVAANEIDEKNRSPISLMPNGLKDGLTLEAFTDLVAYLESLKEPAKK